MWGRGLGVGQLSLPAGCGLWVGTGHAQEGVQQQHPLTHPHFSVLSSSTCSLSEFPLSALHQHMGAVVFTTG